MLIMHTTIADVHLHRASTRIIGTVSIICSGNMQSSCFCGICYESRILVSINSTQSKGDSSFGILVLVFYLIYAI